MQLIKPYLVLIGIISLPFFMGCSSKSKDSSTEQEIANHLDKSLIITDSTTTAEEILFYNIFSPVDMGFVYNSNNSYFNADLLNPLDHLLNYSTSAQKALNFGVYGADLSYLHIFSQNQQALSYLSAIQYLSKELNLPNDYVSFVAESFGNNIENQDSLILLLNDAYNKTDRYLKNSDRENAAVLILYGGWIETLYILTNLYNKPNESMASSIATQKFSCSSMITLLNNYQDDLLIAEHLILLRDLKKSFDKFELNIPKENVTIDRVKKNILVKESETLKLSPDLFAEIQENTGIIRNYMVR